MDGGRTTISDVSLTHERHSSRIKADNLRQHLVLFLLGKAERTEQRRVGRIENKNSSTICFACRQKGHAARECPNVLLAAQTPDAEGAGIEGSGAGPKKGMKRGKGQMGSDVTGAGGRCYR